MILLGYAAGLAGYRFLGWRGRRMNMLAVTAYVVVIVTMGVVQHFVPSFHDFRHAAARAGVADVAAGRGLHRRRPRRGRPMSRPATLFAVTINHRNAPTEVRERAHLDEAQAVALMQVLAETEGCVACMPVSTCNRTEIYLEVLPGHGFEPMLRGASAGRRRRGRSLLLPARRGTCDGIEAIGHLYRVSAGLESMMLGEPQITGQLKDAYRLARANQEPGPGLLRAFQGAFRAGKRVRTETRITQGAVSVAFAAVELARKFFDHLCDQRAVLVGAGETGALAARHFLQHDIGHLTVVNRTAERAKELAVTLNAERMATVEAARAAAHPREPQGAECGHVVAAPGPSWPTPWSRPTWCSQHHRRHRAGDPARDGRAAAVAKRHGKPLFLLDIAVPRDIHPDVAKVPNTFVFGLDDLDEIVQGNLAARRKQIPHAEQHHRAGAGGVPEVARRRWTCAPPWPSSRPTSRT